MREIKFRVWDKPRKVMVYSDTYCCDMSITFDGEVWCHDSYYKIYDRDFILMQFTGLKDKNGKEIYEGDIAKHPDCNDHILIEWIYDRFGQSVYHKGERNYKADYNWYDLEVIGNIYENPELAK